MKKNKIRTNCIFVFITFFFIFLLNFNDAHAYVTDGLVSYWNFDENTGTTLFDSSGNNNDGTIHGATWVPGISGSALEFNGVDDYISLINSGPSGNSPRTVTFWAKTIDTINGHILSYGGDSSTYGSTFRVGLNVFDGCPGVTVDVSDGAVTYSAITDDGEWHFYAFAVPDMTDATVADVDVYQDGVLLSSISNSYVGSRILNTKTNKPINIGRYDNIHNYFKGIIDEIYIYNRALSADEIMINYISSNPYVYDDFSGDTLDTSKWEESIGSDVGYITEHYVSGGKYHTAQTQSAGGSAKLELTGYTFQTGDSIEYDVDYISGEGNRLSRVFIGEYYLDRWALDVGDLNTEDNDCKGGATGADIGNWNGDSTVGNQFGTYHVKVTFYENSAEISFTNPSAKTCLYTITPLNEKTFGIESRSGHNGVFQFDYDNFIITPTACNIACSSNLDCNDDNPNTEDICNNQGTCEAICSNNEYDYITNGLVSYWRLDEGSGVTVKDYAGDNDGILTNIEEEDWVFGKYGYALSFGGYDYTRSYEYVDSYSNCKYVNLGNDASLDITDEITIEAWAKRFSSSGKGSWVVAKDPAYRLGMHDYVTLDKVPGGNSNSLLNDNTWYHIVGTYKISTEEWKTYINGNLDNSGTEYGKITTTGNLLVLGATCFAGGCYECFDGTIDEVRIYNRALSDKEVLFNYVRRGSCGDGYCVSGESCSSCPQDCACSSGQICCSGECITPICSSNSDCNDNKLATEDICNNPRTCGAYCINNKFECPEGSILTEGECVSIREYPVSITEGLVAYWNFDENTGTVLRDSSGNNNDGTINGATWVQGISGTALEFDGVDDRIEIPDSDILDIGTGDFTLEAWIKSDNTQTHNYPMVISKDRGYNTGGYSMVISESEKGKLRALIQDSNGVYTFPNSPDLTDDTWHHIIVTYDRNGYMIGYVDGTKVGEKDISSFDSTTLGNTHSLMIGYWLGESIFNGIIDEVRIYNRALSADEVTANYMGVSYNTPSQDTNREDQTPTQQTCTPKCTRDLDCDDNNLNTKDKCIDPNTCSAICSNKRIECPPDYELIDGECIISYCKSDDECSGYKTWLDEYVCSHDFKKVMQKGTEKIGMCVNNKCEFQNAGFATREVEYCIEQNKYCQDGYCGCSDGYFPCDEVERCVKTGNLKLGKPCDCHSQCETGYCKNKVCTEAISVHMSSSKNNLEIGETSEITISLVNNLDEDINVTLTINIGTGLIKSGTMYGPRECTQNQCTITSQLKSKGQEKIEIEVTANDEVGDVEVSATVSADIPSASGTEKITLPKQKIITISTPEKASETTGAVVMDRLEDLKPHLKEWIPYFILGLMIFGIILALILVLKYSRRV